MLSIAFLIFCSIVVYVILRSKKHMEKTCKIICFMICFSIALFAVSITEDAAKITSENKDSRELTLKDTKIVYITNNDKFWGFSPTENNKCEVIYSEDMKEKFVEVDKVSITQDEKIEVSYITFNTYKQPFPFFVNDFSYSKVTADVHVKKTLADSASDTQTERNK